MSSSTNHLSIEPFTFDIPSDGDRIPLKMAGKRYTSAVAPEFIEGFSLLFFHANGTRKQAPLYSVSVNNLHLDPDKEQWEPTLTALFQSQTAAKFKLREAWAFDSFTHGDSALLNEQALENGRGIGTLICCLQFEQNLIHPR